MMMAIESVLQTAWAALNLPAKGALIAWIAIMIAVPIFKWLWGEKAMHIAISLGVVAQAMVVVAVLASAWPAGRTILVTLSIPLLGWGVEFLGSHTGIPFGRYHYTGRLRPQIGRVPLIIPLAWLMMLPPSWAVAKLIAGEQTPAFVLLSAVAMTAWDFFLDPQMVGWGFWTWDQPGQYCLRCRSGGIPWINFAGWALASAVMTALLRPVDLPAQPLVLVYAVTWLLEAVGLGFLWKQPLPAAIGFVSMGALLLWAWL
jgi:putative membrane protein